MKRPGGEDDTVTPAPSGAQTEPVHRPDETNPGTSPFEKMHRALPGYQLGETIGRGGMGEVLAAVDESLGRDVAIKRMRSAEPSADSVRRFVREAKVQALLDHPAILPVHELGEDEDGNPYFTMKRLTGTTLFDALGQGRPMQSLLRPFVDVCFATQLAHERGIVHRDIKPSNIMLGNYGDVYVIDWGVARVLGARRTSQLAIPVVDSLSPDATAAGVMLGTPGYMAPEQMKGYEVGPEADVYSLGAILFEILAGEPLHEPGKKAITSTLGKPTDSPAARASDRHVAPELDALCVAALAEEPRERPTAREVAERLQKFLDGDRDLERRREVVSEQLAIAREAISDPVRRAEAGQAAGRALALDPESAEAAQLVAKLVLEPPKVLPPELVASLEESERALNRQRGKTAAIAFLAIFLFLPVFVFVQDLRSPLDLAAIYVSATLMAVLSWHNGKTGTTPLWMLLAGNLALAWTFSRLTGTFVLLVGLVCGQVLALSTRSDIARRRWILVAWVATALLVPPLLEYAGVITSTWQVNATGLVTKGTVIETVHQRDVVFLALGQAATAVAIGLFALSTTRARELAQRNAHIQAWHMQQLVPRGRASSSPSISS